MVESRRPGDMLGSSIVACFGLGGWNVADVLEQAPVVEPIHPFQGGELDGLQAAPRPAAADYFGLVEAVDRLGQGVIVGVANAAGSTPASARRSVYFIATYCDPRSLWWMRPLPLAGRRSWSACSKASRTKPA